MVVVAALWVDGAQIPHSDGQLGVHWQCAVIDWQTKPLIPYSAILKVLIRRLRVDRKWFGVSEGLHSDVQLRVWAEIAPSMSEIGSFE